MNYLLSIVFFIAFGTTTMAQGLLQTKVTITFTNQSLENALQQLQSASKVNLAFTKEDVQLHRVQPATWKQATLETILKEILQPASLEFATAGEYIVITRARSSEKEKKQTA